MVSTETLLLLITFVLVAGSLPVWPYSKTWGYASTSVLSVMLVVLLILYISGGRTFFRSSGQDFNTTVHDAGQDLKAAGREVADSVRQAVK